LPFSGPEVTAGELFFKKLKLSVNLSGISGV